MTRIAIDAMGGDNAPSAPVKGAQMVCRDKSLEIILVGLRSEIENILEPDFSPYLAIDHTSSYVSMADKVSLSLIKERDTTMARIMDLLKEGRVDVGLSAGNTAAFVTLAVSRLGLLEGIERPAIAVFLPTVTGKYTVTLDVGANASPKPKHLFQCGLLGSCYARTIMEIERPRVGLLNVGEESTKGDDLRRETFKLLREADHLINFVGNVEGQDVFQGKVDVLVCDGFTGNILLKASEGLFRSFRSILRRELTKDLIGKFGSLLLRNHFHEFARRCDYADYGGGILLGVKGLVVVSHGRSSPRAIANAIRQGQLADEKKLMKNLFSLMEKLPL
ncbi:MAG: phosphate acyltransferase PlsX [Candidatus Omnitrophica bacterium]|nr:phosphate acyltransferase PlsX [Candidatus Omnitrophota bacterium]